MKRWVAAAKLVTIVVVASSVAFIGLPGAASQESANSGYHLAKKITLSGEGGWDYISLDPATHLLFISRATHVIVVDPDSGKVMGDIPDTRGVHGIAFADEFNRGFTSNGRSASVTIFDTKSLKVTGEAKTDEDPDMFHPARPPLMWSSEANRRARLYGAL